MYSRHYETTAGLSALKHKANQREQDLQTLQKAKQQEQQMQQHIVSRQIGDCLVAATPERLNYIEQQLKNRKPY